MQAQFKSIVAIAIFVLLVSTPGYSEELARFIVPLNDVDAECREESPDEQKINKYVFPPTGYLARTKDKRSERGKALFTKFNCAQCHSIENHGGEVGPPLDGIGGHRGREWLTARLLDPKRQAKEYPDMFMFENSLMPHKVSRLAEAELLSDYLLTLAEPKNGFSVSNHLVSDDGKTATAPTKDDGVREWKPQPESIASKNGKELFTSLHCAACHSLTGSKKWFGPDLAGIGARMDEKKLDRILSGAVRSAVMKKQTLKLGEEQIYDLKMFLLTVPNLKQGTGLDAD